MEMKTIGYTMMSCITLLFIILSIGIYKEYENTENSEIKLVDCSDREGYKIVGILCEKEGNEKEQILILYGLFTSIYILLMICSSILLFLEGENERRT